ncbi:MAG TPA: TIGR02301 family protein [Hyphomicrobiaceae bacterium]|nr:TIGR02301 family protein [Hyphomicrobiaceae bacterium]
MRHCAFVRTWAAALPALVLLTALAVPPLAAQGAGGDVRPYDAKLMRLAEILGAVHYLRELCGANEGQTWRKRMEELIEGEGNASLRRAQLTSRFNNGYRSYSRTYQSCTPSAQTAVTRFLAEGAEIATELAKVQQ